MQADEIARCETLEEISLLFVVVQQLGHGLEEKSHGYLHHHAHEFNELLHQARRKLELIKAESPGAIQDLESQEPPPTQFRPRAF